MNSRINHDVIGEINLDLTHQRRVDNYLETRKKILRNKVKEKKSKFPYKKNKDEIESDYRRKKSRQNHFRDFND